jgi:hypothetical protein
MDTEKIIKVITDIFEGADERDWKKVKTSFANNDSRRHLRLRIGYI